MLSLAQLATIPPMFDMFGLVLPIWFEQFSQQQVDLLNSIMVPFGMAPIPPVDFGLDYDPASLPSGSIV